MFAERERVNLELDGATSHGDPRQREIDLRRDALLATIGIVVVRFAHRRLVHEIDEVRRETMAIPTRSICWLPPPRPLPHRDQEPERPASARTSPRRGRGRRSSWGSTSSRRGR
ncbi:DUF559 domain-containing protein [Micromonospora sp. NPDC085948]|uniref:DUF559 domain-containing protein n=1 Tax=Micromonospora sp. NPDC085948 TaxID=3155293 RepID=UPI003436536F